MPIYYSKHLQRFHYKMWKTRLSGRGGGGGGKGSGSNRGRQKSEKELSSDKNAKDTEVRRLEGYRGRRGRDRINKLF